jgi:hypothetical protein
MGSHIDIIEHGYEDCLTEQFCAALALTTFISQNIRWVYNNGYPECTKIFNGDLATFWRRETSLPKEDRQLGRMKDRTDSRILKMKTCEDEFI